MSYNNQLASYAPTVPQPGDPAASEAWALTEAGRRLVQAARTEDPKEMKQALRLNWRLWTILQAELTTAEAAQSVPDEIRGNMLSLANFIDKHTVGALAEPSAKKLQILIDINRNIAGGLAESAKRRQEAAAAAMAGNAPVGVAQEA